MKLKEALQKFTVYLIAKGDRKPTLATYDQRIGAFITAVGDRELDTIDPEEIDLYVYQMRVKGLATATIASRVRDIRHFWRWCEDRGYVKRSPAKHLKIKKDRAFFIKSIKPNHLRKMLDGLVNKRDRAIMEFFASTGCRSGEVANLRFDQLNLIRREALITGKTDERYVDFNSRTANALREWIAIHPYKEGGYVFVTMSHPYRPVCTDTIYRMFDRTAERVGLGDERHNPHAVRHLVGKRFVEEFNLEIARQKLGHVSIQSTLVYANQDRTAVKRATDSITIF